MDIKEIREILDKISFAPSNLDMGWSWDIKLTKIYEDSGVVLERGFSIRTTFMRPDINSGEIERGYGRWMYVPENISTDGLVKTAWVCAELIVKHELMEAFLYESKKIFDPHKNLKDLQYNSVKEPLVIKTRTFEKTQKKAITHASVDAAVEVVSKDIIKPKVVREGIVKKDEEDETVSSSELFHKQNSGNHVQEVEEYLNNNLTRRDNKVDKTIKTDINKYLVSNYVVFNNSKELLIRLVDGNGKIVDHRSKETYTLSEVKLMLGELVSKSMVADTGLVNQMIFNAGFTKGEPKDDFWIFSNPSNTHKFIVHSEIEHSLVIINKNGDIMQRNGKEMVYENEDYTIDNIKEVLSALKT
tara:strand:- start:13748 stop:14821 length:1074 start_codon:yes stop_codon:yes gene_type:complete